MFRSDRHNCNAYLKSNIVLIPQNMSIYISLPPYNTPEYLLQVLMETRVC